MGSLTIRNLDKQIVAGLDDMAKKRGMSRESLIRTICKDAVETEGIKESENRYAAVVSNLEKVLGKCQEVIDRNTVVLEEILERY